MKVVASLVKQLGGKLTVEKNPDGKGACFRVTFSDELVA
jgi:signal transduction histidine kinase